MASNSFGNLFKIVTWGESHGKAVGVVIDGCPAGLELNEEDINQELLLRAPGKSLFTSPRKELDACEILSGVFEGITTGAPISIIIPNLDIDSSKYEPIKDLLRPGHGNFTYLNKYGVFDYRGGGRSSARETVCRVAAGAIAKKILKKFNISIVAYLKQIKEVTINEMDFFSVKDRVHNSPIFCPDKDKELEMIALLEEAKNQGDSLGAVVECLAIGLPIGLGDPVYEKLEANLAKAYLSLPASKGFEIGEGFRSASMQGSTHNDEYTIENEQTTLKTNHAGGVLAGISTSCPLVTRVAFKPTSSIKKTMQTVDLEKNLKEFNLPDGSRHDPCVAIRAVPVVEAMTALVLVDALLMNKSARL